MKQLAVSRGFFGCYGNDLVSVAVVERFKQESMYGLSARTKKSGAITVRCPLVEVRLY